MLAYNRHPQGSYHQITVKNLSEHILHGRLYARYSFYDYLVIAALKMAIMCRNMSG
jgi:hypothetical protein